MTNSNSSPKKLGLWMATALVVGNMIGSGVFMLPASLANIGSISIVGWLISGTGAILLALLFSRLSKLVPKRGGPYQYPKEGFGEFIGFMSGWGYWASVVLTNAAIAMVFAGYMLVFLPQWSDSTLAPTAIGIGAIWLLTWINSRGVSAGGVMQLVTTILKVIPLFVLAIAGFFFFNADHFSLVNRTGESNLVAIASAISLTLFAFLGIESATIPATDDVHKPEKTIPRATIIGTVLTMIVYMISSVSIFGIIPLTELGQSSAPMADAAYIVWGKTGRTLIAFGALVSTFGALNGWILIQGQMPLAMAEDNMFPSIFKRLSKRNFPVMGLVVSSAIITMVVLANQSKGLVELFKLLILLSTFLVLISYLFSSMAEVLILIKKKNAGWKRKLIPAFLISIPTFAFSLWAIYGSGLEIVFYGFIALMLGTPFYVWSKIQQSRK